MAGVAVNQNVNIAFNIANSSSALSALSNIGSKANAASNNLSKLASQAREIALAFSAFTAVKKTIVDLNKEFEENKLIIAGTLSAYKITPNFDTAMAKSETMIGKLREIAAALPGETQDYIEILKLSLNKIVESGQSDLDKVAHLTGQFGAVAVANQVDAAQAGRDLFLMLEGRAGAHVKMWNVLRGVIGKTALEFNKLAIGERRLNIEKALQQFTPLMEGFSGGWGAKIGEFITHLKEIVVFGTGDLFGQMKDSLSQINSFLKNNKQLLIDIASLISGPLLKVFSLVGTIFAAGKLGLVKNISKAGSLGGLFDFAMIGKLTLVGVALGVVAETLVLLAQNWNGFMDDIKRTFFDIQTQFDSLALVGDHFNPLVEIAKVVVGAIDEIVTALKGLANFGEALGEYFFQFTEGWMDRVSTAKSSGLTGMALMRAVIPDFTEILGTTMAKNNKAAEDKLSTMQLAAQNSGINRIQNAVAASIIPKQQQGQFIEEYVNELYKLPKTPDIEKNVDKLTKEYLARIPNKGLKPPPVTQDFRYSRFDIKQMFAEGFDPDRIAVAFASDLAMVGEHRLSSGLSGMYGLH